MTRSQLQSAAIQSTIIAALDMIISHEISRNAYNNVWEDPVLKNLTTAFQNSGPKNATFSSGSVHPLWETPESFYFILLPRCIFVYALLCPLSYYWQIYLERFFPTRPRGREIMNYEKEKVGVELNEDQEEEVVKRWIAQGRIQRSSVSKWNTLVKWVLHITVGKLWMLSLERLLLGVLKWRSRAKVMKNFKSEILLAFFTSFLSIGPFASLISFIVVPATKRVVFEEAIDSVEAIFLECFYRLAFPWVVQTNLVQGIMANVTETILNIPPPEGVDSMNGRLIGEL